MSFHDSALDPAAVAQVGRLLQPRAMRDPTWPALAAATALALTSVVFAAVMVLAPPVETQSVLKGAPD